MADEATTTDVTNSADAAIQTDASATQDQNSSTTETADDAGETDGLDGASILGDAKTDETAGDDAADGASGDGEGDEGSGDDDGSGEGDKASALTGAPEGDYDLTGLMPEGVTIDQEALKSFSETAKSLNLSNHGLAKLATEAQPIVVKQVTDGLVNNVIAMRAGWDADTRAAISGGQTVDGVAMERDPVYQGKDFEAVSAQAAKAIDMLAGDKLFPAAKADGTPGTFRDFLKSTGMGNHPAMMRFAFLAGGLLSEDSDFHRGGDVSKATMTREEKYYGRSN